MCEHVSVAGWRALPGDGDAVLNMRNAKFMLHR